MKNNNDLFLILAIVCLSFNCTITNKLYPNPQLFDHVLIGFKTSGTMIDQEVSMQIKIEQELKGAIIRNKMLYYPNPINRKGDYLLPEDRKAELRDFMCINYYGGYTRNTKPQSFMIIKIDSINNFEEEVILFFNASKTDTSLKVFEIDTAGKVPDTDTTQNVLSQTGNFYDHSGLKGRSLTCYNLILLKQNRIDGDEFEIIKNQLTKRIK